MQWFALLLLKKNTLVFAYLFILHLRHTYFMIDLHESSEVKPVRCAFNCVKL